jgi:uncharacterized protein (DUF1330 family)
VLVRKCELQVKRARERAGRFMSITFSTHNGDRGRTWQEESVRIQYAVALSLVAGIALGGVSVQGLHAQAKLKAYSIGEIIPIAGGTVSPAYLAAARKALADAGGRSMGTLKGRIFHAEGEPPPIAVAMTEWNSADDARAFFQSKAWKDLAPEGAKTAKTVRRYIVEVEP